eukprot:403337550
MSEISLPQLYGDFPISSSQNVFKQSSTAWLAITFILFLGYSVAKIISNRKTQYGLSKQAEVPRIIKNFLKVIEYDLAPSLLIFYFMIGLGEFFVFAAVFGYFMLIVGALLVVAYQKNSYKLITILRVCLVVFTVCAFLNIFIDNMSFKDAYPNLLATYANGGIMDTIPSTGGTGGENNTDSTGNSTDTGNNSTDTGNSTDTNGTRLLL